MRDRAVVILSRIHRPRRLVVKSVGEPLEISRPTRTLNQRANLERGTAALHLPPVNPHTLLTWAHGCIVLHPASPSHRPSGRYGRLSGFDRVELPGSGDAFEFVFAAVVEREARSGDEHGYRRGDH